MGAFLVLLVIAAAEGKEGVKPWERKVNVPVPVPIELPVFPPTNPFYVPLVSLPQAKQTPMHEDFAIRVPARFAIYVDKAGTCRRAQPLANPLPGVMDPVRQALLAESMVPGKAFGQPAATWVDVEVELQGKIKEATTVHLVASSLDPEAPPQIEDLPVPSGNPQDSQLPATLPDQLTSMPSPKSFSAKVPSHEFRQPLKVLVEVSAQGKVKRLVFLLCPEGLRGWVLASSANWVFVPPRGATGVADAWVLLSGAVNVKVSTLKATGLRVNRRNSYPPR